GTDALEVSGAPAASRVVYDHLQRARQRLHLRFHPDIAGKARAGNEHERFAAPVRLIVKIDPGGYFFQRHMTFLCVSIAGARAFLLSKAAISVARQETRYYRIEHHAWNQTHGRSRLLEHIGLFVILSKSAGKDQNRLGRA